MTIQEAQQESKQQLAGIYEEGEAIATSRILVETLAGIKRQDWVLMQKKEFPAAKTSVLQSALQRLLLHEPLQYVLEEAWFCGLKFYVDSNVLIPRPETEELVEWIISDSRFPLVDSRLIDIGTGSGCIPITLKKRLKKTEAWACDISPGALAVARQNADSIGVDVRFEQLDFLDRIQREKLPLFNCIVSNPPYVPAKDQASMSANVIGFEPHTALFVPDDDPLVFYRALADCGRTHLLPEGSIYMELYENLGRETVQLFQSMGYSTELKRDMQEKERMLRVKLVD